MNSSRTILCIDMDAFFISIEQSLNNQLYDKPSAVIGSMKRGVVITSSYLARSYGVKTGMNRYQALQVCPDLILVKSNPNTYVKISKAIMNYLYNITPDVEIASIDEAFLDITGVDISPTDASTQIKTYIYETFKLTCTIGVATNLLLAKQSTHLAKPNGYIDVREQNPISVMDKFELKDIYGIGRKLTAKFNSLGLYTPQNVRSYGEVNLQKLLGINGKKIYNLLLGISRDRVSTVKEDMKSIGHSMTLSEDITSVNDTYHYLLQLSEMVSSRARRNGYLGDTITLTIKLNDMSVHTYQQNIGAATFYTHDIYDTIKLLVANHFPKTVPVRLLGVTLSGLTRNRLKQITIEDILSDNNMKNPKLYEAIDLINNKYGERSISYASILKCKQVGNRVISPSWRHDGERTFTLEDN